MPRLTQRRWAGAVLLVALPFQTAGCALGYTYERHSLPGDALDTLSVRQLFGESVRLTLRSGRTVTMEDVSLENDTLFGSGLKLPFDSVAQLDIRRFNPTTNVKTTRTVAQASSSVAGILLVAVGIAGFVLLLKAIATAIGDAEWGKPNRDR